MRRWIPKVFWFTIPMTNMFVKQFFVNTCCLTNITFYQSITVVYLIFICSTNWGKENMFQTTSQFRFPRQRSKELWIMASRTWYKYDESTRQPLLGTVQKDMGHRSVLGLSAGVSSSLWAEPYKVAEQIPITMVRYQLPTGEYPSLAYFWHKLAFLTDWCIDHIHLICKYEHMNLTYF